MATFKYFSGTTELVHVRPMRNTDFWKRFGFPRRGVAYDGFSKFIGFVNGRTMDADAVAVERVIEYKRNPSLHKCDGRCLHAKGRNCECSCGGANHGAGSMGQPLAQVLRKAA